MVVIHAQRKAELYIDHLSESQHLVAVRSCFMQVLTDDQVHIDDTFDAGR